MTEITANQGAAFGIKANAIAPFAATGTLLTAWSNQLDKIGGHLPKAEYNVPLVLYLSSGVSTNRNTVTGRIFEMGLGWHASTRLRRWEGSSKETETPWTLKTIESGWKNEYLLDHIKFRQKEIFNEVEYNFEDKDVLLYSRFPEYISDGCK